ncbi:MAG: PD-(D/E)XK nuclease family transposase [Treponema sp.]|nr:PD-(D/E)XK nuclease family transposase [Treponema sp.]
MSVTKIEPEIILTNSLEIHFINMVKYKKQVKTLLDDPLNRWLTWFNKDSPPELLQEVVRMDSAIQTAEDRLHHVTQSEEDMRMYTRYMMAECDRTSQLNFARDEGRKEGCITIARNLLAKGSTPEFVQEITGLDLETIRQLT